MRTGALLVAASATLSVDAQFSPAERITYTINVNGHTKIVNGSGTDLQAAAATATSSTDRVPAINQPLTAHVEESDTGGLIMPRGPQVTSSTSSVWSTVGERAIGISAATITADSVHSSEAGPMSTTTTGPNSWTNCFAYSDWFDLDYQTYSPGCEPGKSCYSAFSTEKMRYATGIMCAVPEPASFAANTKAGCSRTVLAGLVALLWITVFMSSSVSASAHAQTTFTEDGIHKVLATMPYCTKIPPHTWTAHITRSHPPSDRPTLPTGVPNPGAAGWTTKWTTHTSYQTEWSHAHPIVTTVETWKSAMSVWIEGSSAWTYIVTASEGCVYTTGSDTTTSSWRSVTGKKDIISVNPWSGTAKVRCSRTLLAGLAALLWTVIFMPTVVSASHPATTTFTEDSVHSITSRKLLSGTRVPDHTDLYTATPATDPKAYGIATSEDHNGHGTYVWTTKWSTFISTTTSYKNTWTDGKYCTTFVIMSPPVPVSTWLAGSSPWTSVFTTNWGKLITRTGNNVDISAEWISMPTRTITVTRNTSGAARIGCSRGLLAGMVALFWLCTMFPFCSADVVSAASNPVASQITEEQRASFQEAIMAGKEVVDAVVRILEALEFKHGVNDESLAIQHWAEATSAAESPAVNQNKRIAETDLNAVSTTTVMEHMSTATTSGIFTEDGVHTISPVVTLFSTVTQSPSSPPVAQKTATSAVSVKDYCPTQPRRDDRGRVDPVMDARCRCCGLGFYALDGNDCGDGSQHGIECQHAAILDASDLCPASSCHG